MKEYKPRVNLNMLRLFAKGKEKKEIQELYQAYTSEINYTLYDLDIKEISKLILTEIDPYLREYECESLSHKLVDYIGPIDIDYLDQMLAIFSISAVWRLATGAKFDFIREKAKRVLDERLEPYDYQGIEKRKQK